MTKNPDQTPLVIVGGGAAGLMGACYAGELGVPTLLIERKHRLGSKLLMCGNGRCNLTSRIPTARMLEDFGAPLTTFLRPALDDFGPARLMQWFESHGLPLMQTSDGKVFPRSERAPDVVHCFQDELRRLGVATCMQAPVEGLEVVAGGFRVRTSAFSVDARHVLVTTGGVSYPKTGSVGDGQRLASQLGLRVQPFRPGLAGIDWEGDWGHRHVGVPFKQACVRAFDGQTLLGEERGLLECERWGLGGGCISNATRLLSRANATHPALEICSAPGAKPFRIDNVRIRPLKEAMVTVGGVDLGEVSDKTMESHRVPGLFFAGEVLDVDGPTGGYNLTAAFATARLAVREVARRMGTGTEQQQTGGHDGNVHSRRHLGTPGRNPRHASGAIHGPGGRSGAMPALSARVPRKRGA